MVRRIALLLAFAFLGTAWLPLGDSKVWAFTTEKKKDDKVKKKKTKPSLEYQKHRRMRKVDVQMAEKRKLIREQILTLLEYEEDPSEKPALMFRLAENYFEESMAVFFQAQELDDELAKDPTNARIRKKVAKGKKALRAIEVGWREKAIDLYKQIVNNYPKFPGRDQVLFSLGYSLWDIEKYKEALTIYKRMIQDYPKSQYVPDAYLAFGEFYFDKAKLERALIAYKKAAEYKESEIYPYAVYKQGWCYFNLHEWDKAKEQFEAVVLLADMESATTGRKIEIRKEALNDFTLTYSHKGSAKAAPRLFKRLAPKDAPKMLIALASMYFGDGQDKKSVILYRYLIKMEKCSAEVPFYQGRIVDAASRVGNKRYVVAQTRRLVELFKEVQQCVKNPDARQKERIKEGKELAEITLRKLSSVWYKEAKETKQKKTFEYAQEMFGDYLELFPKSKDAYDMRFAYAELLFHRLARFERAASEYTKLVVQDLAFKKKHGKFPPKQKDPKKQASPGTYLCDSAYKAMQANREIMKKKSRKDKRGRKARKARKAKKDKKGKKGKKGKKKEGMPIPKYKKRFIQSAEIYMDNCPTDKDILDVKYDIAKAYYDYYYIDEAVKRFDEIVKDFPTADLTVYAANLVLDAYSEREDWEGLNKYARKYYRNKDLMKNAKLRKDLSELIPRIAFKRINKLEDLLRKPPKGKKPLSDKRIYSKVAYAFVKFYKEFPGHSLADEALFNASVKYEQSERLDKARKARQLLIDKYPKSDLVPGAIFNLAENYERMADFDAAASLYERYANTYKKMKGLGKAVSYRKTKRRHRKRKRKRKAKAKVEKKEKKKVGNRRTWNLEDAQAALLNAGIYREALRQYAKAAKDRREFVKLFPNAEDTPQVFFSLGLLYESRKQYTKAAAIYKEYAKKYLRSHTDQAIAAHMRRAEMLRKGRKGLRRESDREVQTTLALYRKYKRRKKPEEMRKAAEAAAHAAFILAGPTYNTYIKYRFTATKAKRLKKQLVEKQKRLKKLTKVYEEVAKRKQPEWAIASLYKLGRAYEDFAQTFYKAPMPKGLTPEQKDIYIGMLREKGQPWEDKAVAHFKASVDKGSDLGFYSRFTQLALTKLQHYRPAEYPREELGFKLAVVAESAARGPLLLALWDKAKLDPKMLNEPPLVTKRINEPSAPPPKVVPEPVTDKSGPAEKSEGKPEAKPEEKEKASAEEKKPKEMGDPLDGAFGDDEPDDDFD